MDRLDDVVAQGRDDPAGSPRWLVRGGLALALAVGGFLVLRPGLLSADEPAPEPAPTSVPAPEPTIAAVRAENTSQGVSVVVRRGDKLERYEAGSGRRPLATLPRKLPPATPLVHVAGKAGTGPLLGVDGTVLFRANPARERALTGVGRAVRIVGPAAAPGRALVVAAFGGARNGPRLVEVAARTGAVTDASPYPGFDLAGPWAPAGVVRVFGRSPLLLTRPAADGRLALALIGPHDTRLTQIGSTGRLLGVVDDRVLTVDGRGCPSAVCPITVLTVRGDGGVLRRPVVPPPGWVYGQTVVAGDGGDPVVVVTRRGEPSQRALARLSAGAERGLLIDGSQGLVSSVAPAGGAEGSVVFALPRPEGARLAVWRPGAQAAALLVDLPALLPGTRLVCACR